MTEQEGARPVTQTNIFGRVNMLKWSVLPWNLKSVSVMYGEAETVPLSRTGHFMQWQWFQMTATLFCFVPGKAVASWSSAKYIPVVVVTSLLHRPAWCSPYRHDAFKPVILTGYSWKSLLSVRETPHALFPDGWDLENKWGKYWSFPTESFTWTKSTCKLSAGPGAPLELTLRWFSCNKSKCGFTPKIVLYLSSSSQLTSRLHRQLSRELQIPSICTRASELLCEIRFDPNKSLFISCK